MSWTFTKGMHGRAIAGAASVLITVACAAHTSEDVVDVQARAWLETLPAAERGRTAFATDDPERFRFRWTPGGREGVRLDALDADQRAALSDLLRTVLSDAGAIKVDAIIATEAALGVIEGSTAYRDPDRYWTAIFGEPGRGTWGLRFEGHHLSVNLTFRGAEAPGGDYYYRIAGRRPLIEHDNRSGGSHVHAVWRDARQDFGGP